MSSSKAVYYHGDRKLQIEAYIYPEEDVEKQWHKGIDGVTGASIKFIDKDKRRSITPLTDDFKGCPFEKNYLRTTWLLYKNFSAAIKGKEELALELNDAYQSSISVHMANRAIREERIERWLPEYDI